MRAIKYYYSDVAQLVRAPGLRSGGRKFESCHFELLVTTPLLYLCACGGMADTSGLGPDDLFVRVRVSPGAPRGLSRVFLYNINFGPRTCRPTCINSGFLYGGVSEWNRKQT